MVADTTKYAVLMTISSLQSVVEVHQKIVFYKLRSKYEKIQLMGYFWSPLIVLLNTAKIMMAVLVRRFYDVCKYKASLGTAKRSSRINSTAKLPGVYAKWTSIAVRQLRHLSNCDNWMWW